MAEEMRKTYSEKKAEAKAAEVEKKVEEELVEIKIDLAPYSAAIIADGKAYYHGRVYKVTQAVFETLVAMCGATWRHEWENGMAHSQGVGAQRNPQKQLNL